MFLVVNFALENILAFSAVKYLCSSFQMQLAVVGLVCRFILQNNVAELAVEGVIQLMLIIQMLSELSVICEFLSTVITLTDIVLLFLCLSVKFNVVGKMIFVGGLF